MVCGALVAACGRGGSSEITEEELLGRFAKPEDTTGQAKKGGIFQTFSTEDSDDHDPLRTVRSPTNGQRLTTYTYQNILNHKRTFNAVVDEFVGDAAESWEMAEAGLKLTVKLRANNKFDPRPPTNGRAMNAQDVVYSWKEVIAGGPWATLLSNEKDPAAAIESITAVDDRTLVFRQAYPWAALLGGLAETGAFQIAPVERDGKFNAKTDMRGSGPWMLQEHETSVRYGLRKNPGFFDASSIYLDGFDMFILPEATARLAQFRAKRIYDMTPNATDLLRTLNEVPALRVYRQPPKTSTLPMWFSGRPDNPFRDARVRRAASMSLDRNLYADALSNREELAAAGLPIQVLINNYVSPAYDVYVDPMSNENGDAAQYFKHNIAEAKKLLAAAGFASGIDVVGKVSAAQAAKPVEITFAMMSEAGFHVKHDVITQNDFSTKVLPVFGDWDGDVTFQGGPVYIDPAIDLLRRYSPKASQSRWSCLGNACDDEHQRIYSMLERVQREVDPQKYRSSLKEIQRALGVSQGAIVIDYNTTDLNLVWPWVKNWYAFLAKGLDNRPGLYRYAWLDQSQMS